MLKTKLQELCHQRQWALPQYTVTRHGPDHNPLFRATVAVEGLTFDAPEPSKSSKEAQNKAAQAAIDRLAAIRPPRSPAVAESQVPYKSQLHNLLTRKNVVPIYGWVREGPPHALRFKATVAVNGQTFESPEFCNTLREAEHAAAQVALLALAQEESQQVSFKDEDEPGFYKNLLQELAQKEGLSLPVYKTVGDGSSHMPTFSSTVQIEGEFYNGVAAKTKKQAEMNAARVACCQFKERRAVRVSSGISSSVHMQNDCQLVSARSESSAMDLQRPKAPSLQVSWNEIDAADIGKKKEIDAADASDKSHKDDREADMSSDVDTHNFHTNRSDTAEAKPCSIRRNRVIVYPRKPDLVLPEGATMLPFSDDKWVAVSLDFPNDEGDMSV